MCPEKKKLIDGYSDKELQEELERRQSARIAAAVAALNACNVTDAMTAISKCKHGLTLSLTRGHKG